MLRPLVDALRRHVLDGNKLHADDTPVPVLCPGRGTTKQGRLWTYVHDDRPSGSSDPPAVWFAYSPDRKGIHPHTHLAHFRGILQVDGYAGFEKLYNDANPHQAIKEAACWAHVRIKFYDIHKATQSPLAMTAMQRIGELYGIEEHIRGQLPDIRRDTRQVRSAVRCPAGKRSRASPLTGLSKSTTTVPSERFARSLLEGKNYLFAGSDAGGARAAAIYSLVGSAKLIGHDPQVYLRHVIECIADHPVNQIEELLP